ncbi:hypothetical protein F5884DRAFT_861919 [Xylogone sp. PMI_703]|nr:hypothetical protein F5884DRAFT_861919 [Xylogone sp. PMI_703]
MVFSFVNPERQTYLLWHRFQLPTSSGSKDAIAVSKLDGDELVSVYTCILEHIIMLVCGMAVLTGVLLSTRRYGHDHSPSLAVSKELVFVWVAFRITGLAIKYAIPIIFARHIKIGNGAPVNPKSIFVPSRNDTGILSDASNVNNLEIFNFYVPAALRAVGAIDSFNRTLSENPPLSVAEPETIGIDETGGLIIRYGYQYNVTGKDFGLQHYSELHLQDPWTCRTEYNWWAGSSNDVSIYPGTFVEEYIPFNMGCCYFTGPNPFHNNETTVAPYMVQPQRPVLSCWENDVWSYKGHSGSITDLSTMPGLNMPPGLSTIFIDSLGLLMIYLLGTYLQVSALKSSVTALSDILDANSSCIFSDLERLVFASYLATINRLTETTLFPPSNGFLNDVAPGDIILQGSGDFVIYSGDIDTLSVRSLIIIPVLAVGLFIISLGLLSWLSETVQIVDYNPKKASEAAKEKDSRIKRMTDSASRMVQEFISLGKNAVDDLE